MHYLEASCIGKVSALSLSVTVLISLLDKSIVAALPMSHCICEKRANIISLDNSHQTDEEG